MLEQVKTTIRKYNMFVPGDRVLVGVSGGPDSVALIHLLDSMSQKLQIELFIAHLDHSFRGRESAEDAEFVRCLADQLQITAVIRREDIASYALENKLSAQAAAREVRYLFFADTARELKCSKLATGHNANDQAETILLHFLRGSGLSGLGGIPPVRDGWVCRPLIEVSRTQIEEYCRDKSLVTRLDQSNLKNIYTRNKLRLELIPILEKEYNSNLIETLVRTGEIMRDEENYLEDLIRVQWDDVCLTQEPERIVFSLDKFLSLPALFQRRLARRAWALLAGTNHNLGFVHLTAAVDVLRNSQSGSGVDLPLGIRLSKSYREFTFSRLTSDVAVLTYAHKLAVPGLTPIPETGEAILAELTVKDTSSPAKQKRDEITLDFDLVSQPLTVRSRKPGDWFKPYGLEGSKKLKKFFIDDKIPRPVRDRQPVLVNGNDEVVWVVGLRADGRWLANRDTKRALKLKLIGNI